MQTKESNGPLLPLLVLLFLALIAALHLGGAIAGKSLFRASHLGTALEYADGSIDLLHPIMTGFNATGTPTAQELPLWQAAAALAFKITGSRWFGWANLVSLLLFATALWPLFQLAKNHAGERVAWWTLLFFLAQPLIVVNAGMAGTDGLCLVLIVWFLYSADHLFRTGNPWWSIPTALFAALAAVSKLPFLMTAGLCSVFMLAARRERQWRIWLALATAGAFAAIAFVLWTRHTAALAAQAEYPFVELRPSQSPFITYWYFGDLHFRLSPMAWLKGAWRFLHATLGSLALIVLPALALCRRDHPLPKLWLLATFLTTLVFTHLILAHWHYYLMCSPAMAWLCAATMVRWENSRAEKAPWTRCGLALMGVVLLLSAIQGMTAMKIGMDYDTFPRAMSEVIRDHTRPEDKLVVHSAGTLWGGEELFRAKRKGFYVFSIEPMKGERTLSLVDLLQSEAHLRRLKELGYNKLVLISESPVRFAASAINPGKTRSRLRYPAHISDAVDAWPAVYSSEDILIKEIP